MAIEIAASVQKVGSVGLVETHLFLDLTISGYLIAWELQENVPIRHQGKKAT